MSNKVAPRVQLNFAPEDIIEENSQPSCDLDSPVMPIDIPEVIERDEIVENDIFLLEQKKINESPCDQPLIISEVSESESPPPQAKQQPLPQKKQTKNKTKRKLSEDHKAKLALAREKALITRRKNAEEKKRMKQIEKQTKELKKKKAQKDLEQLEDEVINADKPRKSTPVSHGQTFTKEDLENASLEAIMKYETIRKARKEEKKKQQMIDQQKKDLQKKIQGYGARDTNGKLINRWNACY